MVNLLATLLEYEKQMSGKGLRIVKRIIRKLSNISNLLVNHYYRKTNYFEKEVIRKTYFYRILNDYLISNNKYRDNLLKIKYINFMEDDSDEKVLLDNDFDLSKFKEYKLDDNIEYSKEIIIDSIKEYIDKILYVSDEDYENSDTGFNIIIDRINLKSYLEILDKESYDEMYNYYKMILDTNRFKNFKRTNMKYIKNQTIIIEAFESYGNYKDNNDNIKRRTKEK